MARNWHRAAFGLVVSLLTVAVVGCGHTQPTWQEATSATGNYVAEFPAKPTTRTLTVPGNDTSAQLTEVTSSGDAYTLSETALSGTGSFSLDAAVDGSMENSRAGQESSSGRPVTATETSRITGDFEGVETRRFSYDLVEGDKLATTSSLVFYRNGVVVQALVVADGAADSESVDRFLSSVRPSKD
jgi:hypothetical protein